MPATTPTLEAPYAGTTRILDADSHVMELPGWLETHAEESVRDRIRPLYLGGAGALADKARSSGSRTPWTVSRTMLGRGSTPATTPS